MLNVGKPMKGSSGRTAPAAGLLLGEEHKLSLRLMSVDERVALYMLTSVVAR